MTHLTRGMIQWVAVAASLAVSPFAVAALAVIDFEDISSPVFDNIEYFYGPSVDSGGYHFASVNHASGIDVLGSWKPAAGARYTGSVALWPNYVGDQIRMTKVGGGVFSVSALDLADVLLNNDDRTVTIVGTHPDSTTVTDTFDFTDSTRLVTYTLTGMTNLSSMTVYAGDFPFQMDNIRVLAVPEADKYAMLGIGIGVIGVRLQRRKPIGWA